MYDVRNGGLPAAEAPRQDGNAVVGLTDRADVIRSESGIVALHPERDGAVPSGIQHVAEAPRKRRSCRSPNDTEAADASDAFFAECGQYHGVADHAADEV